jgi:DNA-binding transcriptional ArsR family regulator
MLGGTMAGRKLPVLASPRAVADCVNQLKVLADATRLAVVRLLLERPHFVNELSERLGVEQSLLSHHLRTLRDARLVEATREGKHIRYTVPAGVGRSMGAAETIDLGCCKLAFDPPARKRA